MKDLLAGTTLPGHERTAPGRGSQTVHAPDDPHWRREFRAHVVIENSCINCGLWVDDYGIACVDLSEFVHRTNHPEYDRH